MLRTTTPHQMATAMSLTLIGAALLFGASACSDAQGGDAARKAGATAAVAGVSSTGASAGSRRELTPEEQTLYRDAAKAAWMYMANNYQPSTGYVNATPDWSNTTLWDIGGQLLAFHAAKELGLIPAADYDKRTRKTLSTLARASLFRKVAYNRVYSTKNGATGDGGGHGFAATDLGRFLSALKVLSVTEPKYAAQIARIVKRIDMKQVVYDGYLHGQLIGSNGKLFIFQEGRIGYEQYAANGFHAWGVSADNAMDLKKNSTPITVMGVPLLGDTRYQDRLLSEPFILYGIEFGMPPDVQDLAANLLKAQQARYDSTGKMTMVTEDASSVAPHYFYYYCVYCNGKPFVIDIPVPGQTLDAPRWVSTKASFGWHALMPSPYTLKAIAYLAKAKDPTKGWASGVMEATGESTHAWDVNTASVVLEAAYFALRGGKPLIDPTGSVTK